MMKKMLMMILLLGIISASGCHTAERASVRADYYGSYPGYGDPYSRYYADPYYNPAYFYGPYPYFFGGSFFFFEPNRRIIIEDRRFSRPRPSLRGGGFRGGRRGGGSGFSSPGPTSPAPAPAPAPGPSQRNLR
jgi:hypothetical protein